MIIPEILQSVLEYDDEDVMIRNNKEMTMTSMTKEFVYVLSNLFHNWDKSEWKAIEYYKRDNAYCICSKKIENICLIEHIPTETYIQVGCDCVKKINKKTYKEMMKLKKQYEQDQLNNHCLDCHKDISTQRIKYPTIRQCWDCRDKLLTNTCMKCDKKIQKEYKLCYGCKSQNNRYF